MPVLPHSGLYLPTTSHPAVRDLEALPLAHATPWKAQVYLGGERVATAECTGVEGAVPYLADITPGWEAQLKEHIAGCRHRGEEVDEGEWLDALVEEYEAESLLRALRPGQVLERARTLTGHTTYQLAGPGAGARVPLAGERQVWSGTEWSPVNDQ